jgi:hypothetical protein
VEDTGRWNVSDLPAIIGAVSLLIGAVFTGLIGLSQRRSRIDRETLDELDDYHRWHPRVRRALVMLRATIAESTMTEPDGIDALVRWPPPKPRHSLPRDEVTADDAG